MVFQNRIYFSNTADSKKKFKQKLATILNNRKVFSTIQIIHFKKNVSFVITRRDGITQIASGKLCEI